MKILACTLSILFSLSFFGAHAQGADSTGLPGDNLNLYAVLDLFKESKSVEDFEKRLNDPNTRINNLDLNNDGYIDYIRVVDYGKDNLHSLVLQVPVNQTESQDVAVIEVEKNNNGSTRVQVVGDEDLYGPNYVIEPQQEQEAQVPSQNLTPTTTQVVYVDASPWPSVAYMYGPSYSFWVSPWYWGYYPGYWHPWRPYGWVAYRHWWYYDHPFHYYHRVYVNYVPGAYTVYAPHKTTSVYVQKNVTVIKNNGVKAPGQKMAPGNAQPQQKSAGMKSQVAKSELNSQPVQNGTAKTNVQGTHPVKQNVQQGETGTKQPVQKPANNTPQQNQVAHQQQQQVNRPVQPQRQQRVQQPHMNAGGGQRPMRTGGGGHMGGGGRRR